MHLLPVNRRKSFRLFVESGSDSEPADRWFGSLRAALRAFRALDDRWKPFAWIIEYHDQPVIGGIQVVRNVVHMKHGRHVQETSEE
jgi:hypothetical protein